MSQNSALFRLVFSLTLAIGLLSGCALSFQPKDPDTPLAIENLPADITPTKLVEVEFTVYSPQKFSEEDEVALDIVDLISGVSHNLERYVLNRTENCYSLRVSLPESSIIAYRYTLTHPIEVSETLPDGSSLSFRQIVVRENLLVNDLIAGWPEAPYSGPLVDLNGAVADDETEAPLPDVLINVAGKTALTDMNGRFFIRGLPTGKHNLVASLADGSYLGFQQEVNMVENLATLAIIRMTPLPEVTVTFVMTPPNEAVGAPVRIAGNLRQFGQTYADMLAGFGAQAVNMPLMARNADGKYVTQLNLYAGSSVRYQYTLGDAFINIERGQTGDRIVREFIVPDKDVIVDDQVATWRSQQQNAVTLFATSPGDHNSNDQLYIQFDLGSWSNPIPMWPMENNQWMLVYNPRSASGESVIYRYCRNADCRIGEENFPNTTPRSFIVGSTSEIRDEISGWRVWDPTAQANSAHSPVSFDEEALVGVEIDPVYLSNHLNAYYGSVDQLKASGFNWLILTPTWKVGINKDLPFIDSDALTTIPSTELNRISRAARDAGIKIALYPQLIFPSDPASWWNNSLKSMIWWQQWYAEYERMTMHAIKLATAIKADHLILGGPDVATTYPGAMETVGENFGTPKTSEKIWTDLLTKTDEYYEGQILLAQEVGTGALASHSFFDKSQGFYLLFNSDLNNPGAYTVDSVGGFFDSIIYGFYEAQQKPVYFGLNGASFTTADTSDNKNSSNIISSTNGTYNSHNVDLDAQSQFYSAYLNAISVRGWVSGVASRGYFPGMKMTDFSSSIYGKPALNLFNSQ